MNQLKKMKNEAQSVIPSTATDKKKTPTTTKINDENDSGRDKEKAAEQNANIRKNGGGGDLRKKSLKEIPGGMINIIEHDKAFDPRKRYSIGNGDVRLNGKSVKNQQRKLSADMRLRGSNSQLSDEHFARRPVRLRNMTSNFEVYDSLHIKAVDVSTSSNANI